MDRLKRFFINGIVLTLVALVSRYVSVGFNIYLSKKIGSVAMGLFTLVSSVYGFALTLATSGINLATTKLVSESLGKGAAKSNYPTEQTVSKIMKKSILFSLFISFSTSVALFAGAEFIGVGLLDDSRTVSSIKILALSLVPIAVSSSLCGYFSAVRQAYKNAAIQVFTQALRISLCVFLLSSALAKDMESACSCIVLATTISEISAFIFELFLFTSDRRRKRKGKKTLKAFDSSLPSKLISITLPVALSAYVRSALVTIEHLMIPRGLEKSGASRELSLASYGVLHSLVFPLILFPSAISSAFANLLVPEISESAAEGDAARIERIVSRVLKTVLIYSIGTAGIMMYMARELGRVLINAQDADKFIIMIAPLIPFMYLDTSVDSILKGLGYQFHTMVINIVDATLSVILVALLLPKFGIIGYVITVYFTELVNLTLSLFKLLCVTQTKIQIINWIAKPIASIIGATACVGLFFERFLGYASSRSEIFFHIVCVSLIYFIFLSVLRVLSPKKIWYSFYRFIKA